MTRDEFDDRQLQVTTTAFANQLYHQEMSQRWIRKNRSVQIAVAFLASFGLCLSLSAALVKSGWLDFFSVIIAAGATVMAIALNVLQFGDWAQQHLDFFRRWSDLREDTEALSFDLPSEGDPSDDLVSRLKSLDGKLHRICSDEPGGRDELLYKGCQQRAKRSLGCEPVPSAAQ